MAVFASAIGVPAVQADEVTSLPTIRVMAESELREEVGFVPYQEDAKVKQALQHHVYKKEQDILNAGVSENVAAVDYKPQVAAPDMSNLSPLLKDYISTVAAGFQSSDPTNGVFEMLKPLNINRDNADAFREGTMKVNIQDIQNLQQQIKDGLLGH